MITISFILCSCFCFVLFGLCVTSLLLCLIVAVVTDLISFSRSALFPHDLEYLSSCVSAFSCAVLSMFMLMFTCLILLDYSVEIIKGSLWNYIFFVVHATTTSYDNNTFTNSF